MNNKPEYIYSELPAIALLQEMGYHYFNGEQHQERNDITEVILKKRLLDAIKRINPWINDNNLNKAYTLITTVTGNSLMEINQKVWELMRGGTYTVKQIIDGVEGFHAVHFIDYENIENNDFLVVSQMKYHGRGSVP